MTYVVTGGGSGIGQAISWKLAAEGEQVFIVGRRKEMLEETCVKFSSHITPIGADLSTEAGRKKVANFLQSKGIAIKGLVHAAATVQPVLSLDKVSLDAWRMIQAINVEAPLFLTQQLLPLLKGGKVLVISSQIAHVAVSCLGAYCVSKAALSMLYQCFNLDFQAWDIHASSVTPGIVNTHMFAEVAMSNDIPEISRQFYQGVMHKNSLIKPEVVACFIHWLLCSVDRESFSSKEWDIYDTNHHEHWVKGFNPPESLGFA